MSEPRCPSCDSSTLSVERRPDGDARCAMCGWSGKYAACFKEAYKVAIQNPEARIKQLEVRLKEAEEIVRWLADGGPCWSVHSRTMEPTFSHSEQATARAYLEKWGVK
mgnify:CR=1 FL=1